MPMTHLATCTSSLNPTPQTLNPKPLYNITHKQPSNDKGNISHAFDSLRNMHSLPKHTPNLKPYNPNP